MLHLLRMFFGIYRETSLGYKHCLCNAEHLFGAINKIVILVFIPFVPYCNYAWIFYNFV